MTKTKRVSIAYADDEWRLIVSKRGWVTSVDDPTLDNFIGAPGADKYYVARPLGLTTRTGLCEPNPSDLPSHLRDEFEWSDDILDYRLFDPVFLIVDEEGAIREVDTAASAAMALLNGAKAYFAFPVYVEPAPAGLQSGMGE